jgi:hypothetical protein
MKMDNESFDVQAFLDNGGEITHLPPTHIPWVSSTGGRIRRSFYEESEFLEEFEPEERECKKCETFYPKYSFWDRVKGKTMIHHYCENCRLGVPGD